MLLLHLDPATPVGVLDTLAHLAPLAGAAVSTLVPLRVARILDRKGR